MEFARQVIQFVTWLTLPQNVMKRSLALITLQKCVIQLEKDNYFVMMLVNKLMEFVRQVIQFVNLTSFENVKNRFLAMIVLQKYVIELKQHQHFVMIQVLKLMEFA